MASRDSGDSDVNIPRVMMSVDVEDELSGSSFEVALKLLKEKMRNQEAKHDTLYREALDEIEELRVKSSRKNHEIRDLTKDNESLRDRLHVIKDYRTMSDTLREERDTALMQLKEETDVRSTYHRHYLDAFKQTKQLQDLVKARDSEIFLLKKACDEEKTLRIKTQEQVENMKKLQVTSSQSVAESEKLVIQANAQAAITKNKHNRLACDFAELKQQFVRLQESHTQLVSVSSQTQSSITEKEECLRQLRQQVDYLQQQNITLKVEIGRNNLQTRHMQDDFRRVESEARRWKDEVIDLDTQLQETRTSLRELRRKQADEEEDRENARDLSRPRSSTVYRLSDVFPVQPRGPPNHKEGGGRGGGGSGRGQKRKESPLQHQTFQQTSAKRSPVVVPRANRGETS